MQVTHNTPAGTITFWHRESSEANYDYLRFYIDNALQGSWSGNNNWAQSSYNIGAGNHTFRWTYSKDGSVNSYNDAVYIDDITIQ